MTTIEMTTIYLSVIRGETGEARVADAQTAGIPITSEMLSWAEGHGLDADDPDVWLGVQTSEDACPLPGEIAFCEITVPAAVAEDVRANLPTTVEVELPFVLTIAAVGDRLDAGVELAESSVRVDDLHPDDQSWLRQQGYTWDDPDTVCYICRAEDVPTLEGWPQREVTIPIPVEVEVGHAV